jgi:hypothetical protein
MYHFAEGALELPEGFTDRTVNIFESKRDGGSVVVSITRDTMPAGMTLEAVATKFVDEMSTRMRRFEFQRRASTEIGFLPSVQVHYTFFHPDGGIVSQEQAFIQHGNLLIVLAMTSPAKLLPGTSKEFKALVDSIKFRMR